METRAMKRKKLLQKEREEMERTEDRITDLPEGVLHHILSFLPIKFIAQTGVLSKRWCYLWRSYPCLDFLSLLGNPITEKPMDFITTLLSHRLEDSNIKIFRLQGSVSFPCLYHCIHVLVLNKIKVLQLNLSLSDRFDIPELILSCKSLGVLALRSQTPKFCFRFPTLRFINSSGLKFLYGLSLTFVHFMESPSIHNLFSESTFRHLKRLILSNCKGPANLNISCPNLEMLNIYDLNLVGLGICCLKLEVMIVVRCFKNYNPALSWVNVLAPRLRTFYWEHNVVIEKCWMEGFTSLQIATIYFLPDQIRSEMSLRAAARLLSVFSFTRQLFVGTFLVELLADINFAGGLPCLFNNLMTVEIHTGLNKCETPGIACLFQSCPRLQNVSIEIYNIYKKGSDTWNRDVLDNTSMSEEEFWESQAHAMKSILKHLKFVRIHVHGWVIYESTINLVKFLLAHGRALQEMELGTELRNPSGPSLWQRRTGSWIEEFPKASSNIRIIF